MVGSKWPALYKRELPYYNLQKKKKKHLIAKERHDHVFRETAKNFTPYEILNILRLQYIIN